MVRFLVLIPLLALVACGSYPRDIAETSDRIRAEHVVRVGIVAGDTAHDPEVETYVAAIERAAGAQRRTTTGAAEPLMARLEAGKLDIVIGEFAADTPWLTDVAVIDPLSERVVADRTIQLTPVARNGENRWIMLLEKVARDQHPS